MKVLNWFSSRACVVMVVAVVAGAFLIWNALERKARVEFVSDLPAEWAAADATSPTGYANSVRKLIVPERNAASYEWIVQTQQMLAGGAARLRQANYDNAPEGRAVHTASPYRWWLSLVAWITHVVSDAPMGEAVEKAALLADPLLHFVLLSSVVIFAARQLGSFAAALVAVALVALFPLAGEFTPGQPESASLGYVCVIWSILPLVAAVARSAHSLPTPRTTKPSFILAGVAGGLGLWIEVRLQFPILAGIAVGGCVVAWLARRATDAPTDAQDADLPWRAWGISGAATSLANYLFEYAPSHLDVTTLRLEENHPVYAVAWLGGAELLAHGTRWLHGRAPALTRREMIVGALALLAVVCVPLIMVLHPTRGFWAGDLGSTRVSKLADGAVAQNFFSWVARDGFADALPALLPVLVLTSGAAWMLKRTSTTPPQRAAIALSLGPVAVALGLAMLRLQWWSVLDCALIALVAAIVTGSRDTWRTNPARAIVAGALLASMLPGLWRLWPASVYLRDDALSETEAQSVLERDLAHWLARQAGPDGAVVLAPPELTAALIYFGGLRGVTTPYRENADGFAAAVRIAAATSLAEAESLLRRRGIKHILVPSWSADFEEYARLSSNEPDAALAGLLRRWLPPRWLRPVPYQLPAMAGLAQRSVGIFAVVDVQEDVTALSRLAEYFVETGQLEFASRVAGTIEDKYPNDLGGLVARAQVAAARKHSDTFASTLKSLVDGAQRGEDLGLPWDRRVNLAILFAYGNRPDLARAQLQRCLDEMDEPLLRSLTTLTLFNLQLLAKRLGQEITNPELRELALRLLPEERRERLR